MIITSRFLNGVNSAERVSIIIVVLLFFVFSYVERRSLSFRSECRIFTGVLKRLRKRAIVCGVRSIFGIIISVCLF